MPWTEDRGRNGILCFVCHGKGQMLGLRVADGAQQVFRCRDCDGTGFVRHCVGCQGTGRIRIQDDEDFWVDCPECSGKGYPLPKRMHFVV